MQARQNSGTGRRQLASNTRFILIRFSRLISYWRVLGVRQWWWGMVGRGAGKRRGGWVLRRR